MRNAGCQIVGQSGYTLIARLVGANMDATTDQKLTMLVAANVGWIPAEFVLKDCSVSLTTAQGAVYDAASKGGNTIFGSGTTQAHTACTGSGTDQPLAVTIAGSKVVGTGATAPILSLTTAQGAAATANVYVYGDVLGQ